MIEIYQESENNWTGWKYLIIKHRSGYQKGLNDLRNLRTIASCKGVYFNQYIISKCFNLIGQENTEDKIIDFLRNNYPEEYI